MTLVECQQDAQVDNRMVWQSLGSASSKKRDTRVAFGQKAAKFERNRLQDEQGNVKIEEKKTYLLRPFPPFFELTDAVLFYFAFAS